MTVYDSQDILLNCRRKGLVNPARISETAPPEVPFLSCFASQNSDLIGFGFD